MRRILTLLALLAGCTPGGRNGNLGSPDLAVPDAWVNPNPQAGCAAEFTGCYTVYAHSDHVLYHIDLKNKMLVTVGPFNAPMVPTTMGGTAEDVITDLAVAPDDTIYGISHTNLYTVDAQTGQVTTVGPVTDCGALAVALTFAADGTLYAADFKGAFCRVDTTTRPPTVMQIGMLGGGLAISGDLVAVNDGTMFGTAYRLSDMPNMGTQIDNLLVKIDPSTGNAIQTIGSTGYSRLYGVAFALDQVFGFTHDGSGDVVTIDPRTGKGTLFNKFTDPATGKGISFAGAGVNSMVVFTPG